MAVGLIFSGQGAQTVGMGKSLYEASATVRDLYDQANEVLGFDLQAYSFEGPEETLTQTKVCQPALYVQGYAIFALLQEQGLLKDWKNAFGLSLGELTGLAAAGVFDFATGLQLVADRGRLMQEACEATDGGMASLIGGSAEAAESLAAEFDIDVSNYNCPGQIVLAGDKGRVTEAVAKAKEVGFKMAIPLKVAGAYHSRLMQSASDQFAAILEPVSFAEGVVTTYTNVTGAVVSSAAEIKKALVEQIVSPVRFEDCLRSAHAEGVDVFYECGCGNVLAGLAKRTDRAIGVETLNEYSDISRLSEVLAN